MLARRRFVLLLVSALAVFAPAAAQVTINVDAARAEVETFAAEDAEDVRWTSPPAGSNVSNAFKIYRNYDGSHSKFGNISVSAGGPDPDSVATFAALRSSDHALTVMVINKDLTNATTVTVNVANYVAGGAAQVWRLDAGNAITRALPDVAGTPFSLNVPATSITLLVIPGSYLDTPTGLVATATSTTTVNLTWTAVPGASSYRVYRDSVMLPASPTTPAYTDSALTPNMTYLYRVQAVSTSVSSGLSAIDPATTIIFTDDPLIPGTPAKAVHIAQLRAAVNAMRRAAGLSEQVFTDDPLLPGTTVIKAIHVRELRTALDQARATIGIPVLAYNDAAVIPATTMLKSAHVSDLRNGVR